MLQTAFPCDTFLVNLRPLDALKDTAVIVHRKGFECGFATDDRSCPDPNGMLPVNMFSDLRTDQMKVSVLSHNIPLVGRQMCGLDYGSIMRPRVFVHHMSCETPLGCLNICQPY